MVVGGPVLPNPKFGERCCTGREGAYSTAIESSLLAFWLAMISWKFIEVRRFSVS